MDSNTNTVKTALFVLVAAIVMYKVKIVQPSKKIGTVSDPPPGMLNLINA